MIRDCGRCTACCTAMLVDELDKPDWQKCQHIKKTGCTIYEKRPGGCQLYRCMWLQGYGNRSWRPDKKGVVVSAMSSPGGVPHVLVHELVPGTLVKPDVAEILTKICETMPMFEVLRNQRLRLIGGPQEGVQAFMDEKTAGGDPPELIQLKRKQLVIGNWEVK